MGVKGLWQLVQPVSRPVKIEMLEGKRLAIDSSIWLYQFQATMKDKEGRTLVNAHVLGFLRRINKLLFHGIKPVFVFDGGAPSLKRSTIAERQRRKAGATANHTKVAEKLFAAQLRREAVKQAQLRKRLKRTISDHSYRSHSRSVSIASRSNAQGEADDGDGDGEGCDDIDTGAFIAQDGPFLDDYGPGGGRQQPSAGSRTNGDRSSNKRRRRGSSSTGSSRSPSPPPPEPPAKKKYVAKDPYQLPDLPARDLNDKPDPRLATDAELKEFIDEMRAEDFDTSSPDFQLLPREVQYDIISDARIRSRAPNWNRLQSMLRAAPTALDFSKAQIESLQKRNTLTHQMWGLAGIEQMTAKMTSQIGRIASERGKQYVLMKNEGKEGGWVLGVQDEGTAEKPIVVDPEDDEEQERKAFVKEAERRQRQLRGGILTSGKFIAVEDEDEAAEMERRANAPPVDHDLRELRRNNALIALAKRYSPNKPARKPQPKPSQVFGPLRSSNAPPLFQMDDEDDYSAAPVSPTIAGSLTAVDDLDDDDDLELARAIELSTREAHARRSATTDSGGDREAVFDSSGDEMEEVAMDRDVGTPSMSLAAEVLSDEDEAFLQLVAGSLKSRQSLSVSVVSDQQPVFDVISSDDEGQFRQPPQAPARRDLPSVIVSAASAAPSRSNQSSFIAIGRPSSVNDDFLASLNPRSASFEPYQPALADVEIIDSSPPLQEVASPKPIAVPSSEATDDANMEEVIIPSPPPASDDTEGDMEEFIVPLLSVTDNPVDVVVASSPPSTPPRTSSPPFPRRSMSPLSIARTFSSTAKATPRTTTPKQPTPKTLSSFSTSAHKSEITPIRRPTEGTSAPRSGPTPTPTSRSAAPASALIDTPSQKGPYASSSSLEAAAAVSSGSRPMVESPTASRQVSSLLSRIGQHLASTQPSLTALSTSPKTTGSEPTPTPKKQVPVAEIAATPTQSEKIAPKPPHESPMIVEWKKAAARKTTAARKSPPPLQPRQPSPSPPAAAPAPTPSKQATAATSAKAVLSDVYSNSTPGTPGTKRLLEEDDQEIEWSASPTPPPYERRESGASEQQHPIAVASDLEDDEDDDSHNVGGGRHDMDQEQDEYAAFIAEVKGKDLRAVQDELDAEIQGLNAQRRKTTREGDENITQQMIAQIQVLLQLYGIPYVTAPMEAEAQCAELAALNLVDGIITDDSDVFLFGGKQCYKNMFSDKKYVECYVLSDLARELALSRDRLVTFANLTGSDYTTGLSGVGYVTAMEIMAEFPGEGDEGLVRFREWWLKVQTGKDSEEEEDGETCSKWRRAFKKKFKDSIFLDRTFPNPQVRPAYFNPTVDASREPFAWGFPNLSKLRAYLSDELSWSPSKVDDELLPIVQRIAKRGQGLLPKQTRLDSFFDQTAGASEIFAPKVRLTKPSKRLLDVVKRFRASVAAYEGGPPLPKALSPVLGGVADEDEVADAGREHSSQSESEKDEERQPTLNKKKAPARKKATKPAGAAGLEGRRGAQARGGGGARGRRGVRGGAKAGRGGKKKDAAVVTPEMMPEWDLESEGEGEGQQQRMSEEDEVVQMPRKRPRPRTRAAHFENKDDEDQDEGYE